MMTQVVSYKRYGTDMEVYIFGSGEKEEDTWIIIKWLREDWNYWVSISSPKVLPSNCDNFKSTLLSSGLISWRDRFLLTPTPSKPLQMILDMHANSQELVFTVYPVLLFFMRPEVALKLEVNPGSDKVRLGPLIPETGAPFIAAGWPYTASNKDATITVIRKCIERGVSGGVYVCDDSTGGVEKLVCGAVLVANGQISMLYTDDKHRRKGYALLCLRYISKEMGRQGLYSCLGGEAGNAPALNMYKSIPGMEMVPETMPFTTVEKTELCTMD